MIDYIYDGTFDGLLTVIWHHYYTDRAAGIYTGDRYQPSFLQGSREVTTEPDKADRVYKAIRTKISGYDLRDVYRAWLSCDPEKEMKILRYVVLGFRQGHRASSLHGDPVVADFQAILRKISRESERMLQFVRFSVVSVDADVVEAAGAREGAAPAKAGGQIAVSSMQQRLAAGEPKGQPEGEPNDQPDASTGAMSAPPASPKDVPPKREILYARIQPDNDVIELAARHFCDRFRNDPFIIHDVGRNKAVIACNGRWIVSAFAPEDVPDPSAGERHCRRLWKQYFDHIAILERTNRHCQNHFIPDRYRRHLTEITTADDDDPHRDYNSGR